MKALFKLKDYPIEGYGRTIYLTENAAQACYYRGNLGKLSPSRYLSRGFYCKCLTFSEWIDYYHIRIV